MFLDYFDDLESFWEELYMGIRAIWEKCGLYCTRWSGGIYVPPGSLNQLKYSWNLHEFYLFFLSLLDGKGTGYKLFSLVTCPSAYLAVSCSNHRENKIANRSPLGGSFAVFWIPLSSSAWHRCSKRSIAAPSFVAFCAPGGVVVIWPSSFHSFYGNIKSKNDAILWMRALR